MSLDFSTCTICKMTTEASDVRVTKVTVETDEFAGLFILPVQPYLVYWLLNIYGVEFQERTDRKCFALNPQAQAIKTAAPVYFQMNMEFFLLFFKNASI